MHLRIECKTYSAERESEARKLMMPDKHSARESEQKEPVCSTQKQAPELARAALARRIFLRGLIAGILTCVAGFLILISAKETLSSDYVGDLGAIGVFVALVALIVWKVRSLNDTKPGADVIALAWRQAKKGNCALHRQKCEKARKHFFRAVEYEPGNYRWRYHYGLATMGLKLYEEAADVYDGAAYLAEEDAAGCRIAQGDALMELERWEDAFGAYRAAAGSIENAGDAWLGRSVALWHLGRCEQMLSAVTRALQADPTEIGALRGRALALTELGR